MNRIFSAVLTAAAVTTFAAPADAQISITADALTYTQDFNGLVSSGTGQNPPRAGWSFQEVGGSANTSYTANNGASTTGDTYSYGALSSTERALGALRSLSLASTISVTFVNDTGATITDLAISYKGEQWRLGATGRQDRLDVELSADVSSGSWAPVTALEFVAPLTSGIVGPQNGNTASATRSTTVTGLAIPPGAVIGIRWLDFDATGADDGLAIDDFSLTATTGEPQPTNPSGTGSAIPATVAAGETTLLQVVVTPGTNPSSPIAAVTADLTSIGGSATQALDSMGGNLYAYEATVAAGTEAGLKSLPVTIRDELGREGSTTIALTVTPPSVDPTVTSATAVPDHVLPGDATALTVIVEPGQNPTSASFTVVADLSSIGGSSTQQLAEDPPLEFTWVATVAAGTTPGAKLIPVVVTDDRGRQASATIALSVMTPLTAVGQADPATVVDGEAVRLSVTVVPGDFPASSGIEVVGDLSALGLGQVAFSLAGDDVYVYDATVPAGTAPQVFTLPVAVSDDQDRTASAPIVLTVASRHTVATSADPDRVAAGESTLLRVTVTPGTLNPSTSFTVTADLSAIGGLAAQSFAETADDVFEHVATVAPGTTLGAKSLPVVATDGEGRAVAATIQLTVVEGLVAIGAIQGAGAESPRVGQRVATRGVVTQVAANGFWIQDGGDADGLTSDGLFVAGAAGVSVGDAVQVSGTVAELRPGDDTPENPNLTVTALTGATVVTLATGEPVPAAAALEPPDTSVADAIAYLERHEGMRVAVADPVAVSPSADVDGGRAVVVLANQGGTSAPRTPRGGLLLAPGDVNPERIFLSGPLPQSDVGDGFDAEVGGVLDYDDARYLVRVAAPVGALPSGLVREVTGTHANGELAVATLDVPAGADLEDVAALVVGHLRAPDIIAIEDGSLADALIAAITRSGGPMYEFRGGVLFVPGRGLNFAGTAGTAEFSFRGQRLFVIPAYFVDKSADQPIFGRFQPPESFSETTRLLQAAQVRDRAAAILTADPRANVVVLGRMNDVEFSASLLALMDAPLAALVDTLPLEERYTHVVDGNSQALDHILVSPRIHDEALVGYDIVHTSAEFAVRTADGDPTVATLALKGRRSCTSTTTYWKRHVDAWPVTRLTLGGREYGTRALVHILESRARHETVVLARELIAAKLNVAAGAAAGRIAATIDAADEWLSGRRRDERRARKLAATLERFNEARLDGVDSCM